MLVQEQEVSDREVKLDGITPGTRRIYLIQYFSRQLQESDVTLPIVFKELYSLSECLKHWHPYLIGQKTTVFVDNHVLSYWVSMQIVSE